MNAKQAKAKVVVDGGNTVTSTDNGRAIVKEGHEYKVEYGYYIHYRGANWGQAWLHFTKKGTK